MKILPTRLLLACAAALVLPFALGQASTAKSPSDYETLKREAEARYAESSFTLAHEIYERAAELELESEQRDWVDLRLADTQWRAAAKTNEADTTSLERAEQMLRELIRRLEQRASESAKIAAPVDRQSLAWAEANASLGAYFWARSNSANWGAGWPFYEKALSWWGASFDIETARRRYLDLVFELALPPWNSTNVYRGQYATYVPRTILENAVRIAVEDADAAAAHFLLGTSYARSGQDVSTRGRVEEELSAVLALGKRAEWYDDSLFALAQYFENTGRAERDDEGQWAWRADYVEAVELYRRLLAEFRKGETAWFDQAQRRLEDILKPRAGVNVARAFLPGSEVVYDVSWRNASRVELALYPVNLVEDTLLTDEHPNNWLASIDLNRIAPLRRWSHATEDDGEHRPGSATLTLDGALEEGAYVLEARVAGADPVRASVLVSEVALTTKTSGSRVLAWLTNVRTGEPIADATVRIAYRYNDRRGDNRSRRRTATTGADGIAVLELEGADHAGAYTHYFLAAVAGKRQAFVSSSSYGNHGDTEGQWRIYAYTDRATYRPGDDVKWKLVARRYDGKTLENTADEKLSWTISDPRGADVREGEATLDAFGAALGELETTATMALGEYSIRFTHGGNHVGSATLFRIEEYKLPEFEVAVTTPSDGDGTPKLFVSGDELELEIQASYYYGAPVAEAKVEVFVYQRPFQQVWSDDREYPWLYEEGGRNPSYWGGLGNQVHHQLLQTDAAGSAVLTYRTPANANGSFEYTIVANVTDASRREISGQGSVKVGPTEHFARVQTKHAIHRSGSKVELELETIDANGGGLSVEGKVEVTREHWIEIWRDASGKTVRRESQTGGRVPEGWQLQHRGYEKEVVAETNLATDRLGKATWEFTPDRDGTYRATWRSVDSRGSDVVAQNTFFVADENTRQLGFFSGGVEILIDEDTLEVGQDAVLLVTTPASGRWVLLTVEGEALHHHEVVHMDGSVKLVRIPITAEHVPNVWLSAVSLSDGVAYQDFEEIIVPPVRQFLDVTVTHDDETHEPGSAGSATITVQDRDGKPVVAQMSVAIVDDALAYIQSDYAGDPRKFFYGQRRQLRVNTHGSLFEQRYEALEKNEKGEIRETKLGMRVDYDDGQFRAKAGQPMREMEEMAADSFSLGRAASPSARKAGLASNLVSAEGGAGAGAGGGPAVRVRSDFRDTALWAPTVVTDENGRAQVELEYPDSTTRWRTTVRAIDTATRVGAAEAMTRTRQPLIARLQAPRFFLVRDEVTVSGNVNNNTDAALSVEVTLEAEGLELLGRIVGDSIESAVKNTVRVPAGDQVRVDWRVRVLEPGEARLKLTALSGEIGDAIERTYEVYPHGIEALVATSGSFEDGEIAFSLDLPAERSADSTRLQVQVSPSLAVTMLDALPYLADYPYGCTEQTLSRFLPSAIVAKTLRDFGLSAEDAMSRVFGGIEPEFAAATHPKGKRPLDELDRMMSQSLERLYDFQHADGSWSWWKTGEGDHFMTAYVLWGLSLARDSEVELRAGVLERAARWLARELVEEEWNPDLQAWMLHALAVHGAETGDEATGRWIETAFENLLGTRAKLNSYGRALLAIAAHELGRDTEARLLLDNLIDGAIIDDSTDTSIVQVGTQTSRPYTLATAHWGEDGIYHRWSDGGVEATAFALRALVAIDPTHRLVEPTCNWLVQNRRGAQWSNTRDTAITVLALNDYLAASGQLANGVSYAVFANGKQAASVELSAEDLLRAPGTITIDPDWIVSGPNEIRIEKTDGDGRLYFAAYASFFSREEPIPARGNQVFARRQYFKLEGRPTLLEGYVYQRVPLADGDSVTSGERIEVVLTIEAKNNLEYLVFEDLKPAGFEAVQVRSGEPMYAHELKRGEAERLFGPDAVVDVTRRDSNDRRLSSAGRTGRSRHVHQELRDRKVALFIDRLDDGFWELRYDLRAEAPGTFHALPVLGHAMYVPEVRCNGREMRFEVRDAN